jgi:hypothetical protein
MTMVVLSPLRKQGDVNKIPVALTAVLLQGSGAPPMATLPRTQGSSTPPTATLACTQDSGISLPDTLAHSYTPIVHLDPLLASIKEGSGPSCERVAREDGLTNRLTLSPSRTLVTPTTRASPGRRITRAAFSPLVFHLAPTHLGWDTQRQIYSSVQGPPRVETPTALFTPSRRLSTTLRPRCVVQGYCGSVWSMHEGLAETVERRRHRNCSPDYRLRRWAAMHRR